MTKLPTKMLLAAGVSAMLSTAAIAGTDPIAAAPAPSADNSSNPPSVAITVGTPTYTIEVRDPATGQVITTVTVTGALAAFLRAYNTR